VLTYLPPIGDTHYLNDRIVAIGADLYVVPQLLIYTP
jgi:hypothetical protein